MSNDEQTYALAALQLKAPQGLMISLCKQKELGEQMGWRGKGKGGAQREKKSRAMSSAAYFFQ